MSQDWEHELPRVMEEIVDAMEAYGAALSLHADDGGPPKILYVTKSLGSSPETTQNLVSGLRLWSQDERQAHQWLSCDIGQCRDALIIPVERVPKHSLLVISVFFDDLPETRRQRAESVYFGRRPFAIGYFRLWQLERTQTRRIEALETALNLTDLGVILLNNRESILFANDAAEALLGAGDGIRRTDESFSATQLMDSMRLGVAIKHVIAASGTSSAGRRAPILTLPRRQGPALILSVMPPRQPFTDEADVAAIIYVLDPSFDTEKLLQPVCRLYEFSSVETRLVCLLISGSSLSEAATKMRLKEQSARNCLKQVFIKTGSRRQSDLMRVMLSSLIRTSRDIPLETF